jgi:hypothetical protein
MKNPGKLNGAQTGLCWFALHYGGCTRPVLRVIPDRRLPSLYCIHWRDGRVSEPANLTRCLDAAAAFAEQGPLCNGKLSFRWRKHNHSSPVERACVHSQDSEAVS